MTFQLETEWEGKGKRKREEEGKEGEGERERKGREGEGERERGRGTEGRMKERLSRRSKKNCHFSTRIRQYGARSSLLRLNKGACSLT